MTDKQIIIDGVNVAGCEYYTQDYQRANNIEGRYEHCKDVCELNRDNYFYCKMNNNCYYKQFKRLEQENKELKEEIIPNDGRVIDINSSTAKSIMEGVIPKAIRTWTVFKNTNNTLKGIETVAFALWQVALDEIEKESDNVVFMSDNTVKLIIGTLKRLEQENEELKKQYNDIYDYLQEREKLINGTIQDIYKANQENEKLKEVLEEIREYINSQGIDNKWNMRIQRFRMGILNKINEVLK